MCKGKNCMGGYDGCECPCRTFDKCITTSKDLDNINTKKGETLDVVLGKLDNKFKNITVNKVGEPQFLNIVNVNDYTINISLNEQVLIDFIASN